MNIEGTLSPASVNELGLPIGFIDGVPASKGTI